MSKSRRPPRQSSSKELLANHQKSWLWGTVPIWETLQAGSWPIHELRVNSSAQQEIHEQCRELAEAQGIPVYEETPARLEQLSKARDHQGILALMGPFPYVSLKQLLTPLQTPPVESVGQKLTRPVWLLLDQVQDPFNLGAMIRSAVAFGIQGILLGTHNQVGITSHVARSSVGTVNRIPICRVESLPEVIEQLRRQGCRVLAATIEGSLTVQQVASHPRYGNGPLAVVIGNEATGVSQELLALCDEHISIPMTGPAESLNAAVAAGILLFALTQAAS